MEHQSDVILHVIVLMIYKYSLEIELLALLFLHRNRNWIIFRIVSSDRQKWAFNRVKYSVEALQNVGSGEGFGFYQAQVR